MRPYNRYMWSIAMSVLLVTSSWNTASSQWQRRPSLQDEVRQLRATVRAMEKHQRDLEARIAVLERLNLAPSPEFLRQSYLTAARDAIINDLSNISANAYQFRIRPTTMGGGGGSYVGYTIPRKLSANDNGNYMAEVSADSVILTGTWSHGNGSVRATLNKEGRTGGFVYTGDFE
jgi:hypothetical protein